ncbi:hypothetical protein F511_01837 [Dorcoceras hygrometricum]|uniref:Uncharacterized protein n=1 Tax=Dorcoceras hygrometricum TaxID=472368 RepID=A0A2Z7CXH7_9LAMI|nr:hypothetical protein F511_01837 [Dorcoceras hygrometricum]
MSKVDKLIEAQSKGAQIFHGEAVCIAKIAEIFQEFSVPSSIFPLKEIIEVGLNRSSGFIWSKQRSKTEHEFKKMGQTILYDVVITCFVEQRHMQKLTGVKTKKLLFSLPISEMIFGFTSDDKVKVVTSTGLYRVHHISEFENEDGTLDTNRLPNISL